MLDGGKIMRFWELRLDVKNYATLTFVDKTLSRRLISRFIVGKPFSEPWEAVQVYYPRTWEEPGLSAKERNIMRALREGRPVGDFIYIAGAEGAFAINERARSVLFPLLVGRVELLPLYYGNERLHLVNVISVIDCLDEDRSKVERFPSTGLIFKVIEPVFKEELLEGVHIFKFAKNSFIFVSDVFKKMVEEHNLKGLYWTPHQSP